MSLRLRRLFFNSLLGPAPKEQPSRKLSGNTPIEFLEERDLRFQREIFLPAHPNALLLTARCGDGTTVAQRYYSIGGGAIVKEGARATEGAQVTLPHPFSSAAELLAIAAAEGISIGDIVRRNECAWRDAAQTDAFLDAVRAAMSACIDRGMRTEGMLPGALRVKRRAKTLHLALLARGPRTDPSHVFEWVSLWALAVNEENRQPRCGHRDHAADGRGHALEVQRNQSRRSRRQCRGVLMMNFTADRDPHNEFSRRHIGPIDFGFHAPTVSFPVAGTFMIEPTESESLGELDRFCAAMLAIREEIAAIERGAITAEDSPLRHAPHTARDLVDERWQHAYSRREACFPESVLAANKYWCPVNWVDHGYGDRNLVCSCPPTESYADVS